MALRRAGHQPARPRSKHVNACGRYLSRAARDADASRVRLAPDGCGSTIGQILRVEAPPRPLLRRASHPRADLRCRRKRRADLFAVRVGPCHGTARPLTPAETHRDPANPAYASSRVVAAARRRSDGFGSARNSAVRRRQSQVIDGSISDEYAGADRRSVVSAPLVASQAFQTALGSRQAG
jgi:hypothetical protein